MVNVMSELSPAFENELDFICLEEGFLSVLVDRLEADVAPLLGIMIAAWLQIACGCPVDLNIGRATARLMRWLRS